MHPHAPTPSKSRLKPEIGLELFTFHTLFVRLLRDTLYTEQRLAVLLSVWAGSATNSKLRSALQQYFEASTSYIDLLREVGKNIRVDPERDEYTVVPVMIAHWYGPVEFASNRAERDVAIVACLQWIMHLQIANYGTLYAWSAELRLTEANDIVLKCLEITKVADANLSDLAI